MRHGLDRLRKVVGSVVISAGILAIANVETIWQEYHHDQLQETQVVRHNKHTKHLAPAVTATALRPLQSELSRSLEQDELKDDNPFTQLSTMAPLQEIMQRGVAKFQRETLRSPEYHDEGGYDILTYEVEHQDGTKSSILAYLEHADDSSGHKVGGPDERVPFVVFLLSNGATSRYFFFRSGQLLTQSELTPSEAQALLTNRLSQGVPFFSVSR